MELQRTGPESYEVRGSRQEAETMLAAMTQPAVQGPAEDEPRAQAHERLQGRMPHAIEPWRMSLSTIELVALQRAVAHMRHKTGFDDGLRARATVLTNEFIEQGATPQNQIHFSY